MGQKHITIAFLIDRLAGSDGMTGGTERQLIEMANRLTSTTCRPIVISLRDNQDSPVWQSLQCEKHILQVQSLASLQGIKKLWWLSRMLRRRSVNIVQTFFFDATLFGVLAGRLAGVKHILSCRRDMGFWYDGKKVALLRLFNLLTTRILVNSSAVKEMVVSLEKFRPDAIDIIYNGIDCQAITMIAPASLTEEFPTLFADSPIVGIVSNLNRPVKRVDLFLKAAHLVLQNHPDCRFLIIGDGRLRTQLETKARTMGINHSVVFGGARPNAMAYIKQFDIGVLTSDSEGFPNAILEYMAAGKPVVATNVGGNPELITHRENGLLVPVNDHKALAAAINALILDEPTRKKMGQENKIKVEKQFNWSNRIGELEEYYHGLVANG